MRLVDLKHPDRLRREHQGKHQRRAPADSGVLDDEVARVERLYRELDAAEVAKNVAQQELEQTIAAVRADLAQARFDGSKRRPDESKVQAKRDNLAAAEGEEDVLRLAVGQAIDAVWETLEQHRTEWAPTVAADRDAKRIVYADALAAALEARAAFKDAEGLAWTLEGEGRPFQAFGGMIGDLPFEQFSLKLRREAGHEPDAPVTLGENITAKGLAPADGVALPQEAA
jgi:hypothetical protein